MWLSVRPRQQRSAPNRQYSRMRTRKIYLTIYKPIITISAVHFYYIYLTALAFLLFDSLANVQPLVYGPSNTPLFTSRSARSARTAGTKIALRFSRLFVCASALITCAIYYVIRYYVTAVYSSVWRFAGQATANEGSFVLPRWRKRGR